MTRQADEPSLDDEWTEPVQESAPEGTGRSAKAAATRPTAPDLATLPITGITGRRMAIAIGILLAVWIILMFARQVGDASAASARADVLVVSNAEQASRVAALSRELQQIQRQQYIDLEARAYGLGKTREIAFTLDPNAPSLAPDAPGSASVRLGSDVDDGSPLDHWLTLLFGSGH
jgi:hypothetical protein